MVKDVDQALALSMKAGAPLPLASVTRGLLQIGVNTVGSNARLEDMVDLIGSMAGTNLRDPGEPSNTPEVMSAEVGQLPTIGVRLPEADPPNHTKIRTVDTRILSPLVIRKGRKASSARPFRYRGGVRLPRIETLAIGPCASTPPRPAHRRARLHGPDDRAVGVRSAD